MKKYLSVFIILYLVVFSMSYTYKVDTKEIDFGNTINFTFDLEKDESFASYPDNIEDFTILNRDTQESSINYRLLPIKDGKVSIRPLEFKIISSEKENIIKTDTIEININPIIDEEKFKPNPNTGFLSLSDYYNVWNILLFSLIILIVLSLIIYFLFRKKIREKVFHIYEEPAHKTALKALESLKLRDFLENGNQKLFCVELSSIIKNYVEKRYGLDAVEMTTYELELLYFKDKEAIPEFDLIIDKLKKMDLVKFAKYNLDKSILEDMFQYVKEYVLKTREVENDKASE